MPALVFALAQLRLMVSLRLKRVTIDKKDSLTLSFLWLAFGKLRCLTDWKGTIAISISLNLNEGKEREDAVYADTRLAQDLFGHPCCFPV